MTKKTWAIIIAVLMLFIGAFGFTIHHYNRQIDTLENNIKGYRDDISRLELDNGNLLSTKQSLILSEAAARDELEISKKELKELKKRLGADIAYIAQLESQIGLQDTLWMVPDTVYIKDNMQIKQFYWDNEWASIKATVIGESIIDSKLTINRIYMNVPLQLGFADNYKFWVKSSNPYVVFTDVSSIVVDDSKLYKKQRLHHGIHLGFGFQYGLFGQKWDFGPQLGYSLMISF